MNVYDSDKMADVLHAAAGYEPTDDVDEADLILFNTCSVREKAQEKVFSDLGRVKHLKAQGRADRRRRLRRRARKARRSSSARPTSISCSGRRRCTACPTMMARRRASSGRRSTSAFPRSRSSTTCRRRASTARPRSSRSWKAARSTARYCVVPYTRGEEVSRPLDDVLAEVAGLAEQGVREVTLLGQNVNAYRGAMGGRREIADFATAARVRRARFPASSASATRPATRRSSRSA